MDSLYLEKNSKYRLSFFIVKTWWDFYAPSDAVNYKHQERKRELESKGAKRNERIQHRKRLHGIRRRRVPALRMRGRL